MNQATFYDCPTIIRSHGLHVICRITFYVGGISGIILVCTTVFANEPYFDSQLGGKFLADFMDFWSGSRLYWLGHTLTIFDPHAFNGWLETVFRPDSIPLFSTWSYPPSMLLLLLPFGLLAAGPALALWVAVNYASLGLAGFAARRNLDLVAITILSPASLYAFKQMQNGPALAALFLTGIWFVETRPLLAGVCFGLLAAKPQLAILVPVVLLAGRHWRSFGATVLTFAALVLASLALFGIEAWIDFFTRTAPFMQAQLAHAYPIPPACAMPTLFILLRGLGAGTHEAMVVQVFGTVAMIALVGYLWSGERMPRLWRNALTCLAVPLASPFAYVYDLIPTMFAITSIVLYERSRFSAPLVFAAAAVWLWPSFGVWATTTLHLPEFGALALLLLLVAGFRHASSRNRWVVGAADAKAPT